MTKISEIDELSPERIAARLEELRMLYRLTTSLSRARIVGPVEPYEPKPAAAARRR